MPQHGTPTGGGSGRNPVAALLTLLALLLLFALVRAGVEATQAIGFALAARLLIHGTTCHRR